MHYLPALESIYCTDWDIFAEEIPLTASITITEILLDKLGLTTEGSCINTPSSNTSIPLPTSLKVVDSAVRSLARGVSLFVIDQLAEKVAEQLGIPYISTSIETSLAISTALEASHKYFGTFIKNLSSQTSFTKVIGMWEHENGYFWVNGGLVTEVTPPKTFKDPWKIPIFGYVSLKDIEVPCVLFKDSVFIREADA